MDRRVGASLATVIRDHPVLPSPRGFIENEPGLLAGSAGRGQQLSCAVGPGGRHRSSLSACSLVS
jgi:hypothetical protein